MTELIIDQALQQGIEAHKAGKLQEADRLYTAILKAQPKHPDANHNMGILAIGDGKAQESLPFFKAALEGNPSIAQFWLSYIDALIKLEKFSDAKAVFDQAKSKGAKGDGFDQLGQRLNVPSGVPIEAAVNSQEPAQIQSNILDTLKLDQAIKLANRKSKEGSPEEAIRIYKDILTKFPKNKRAADGLKGLASKSVRKAPKLQDPPQDQVQALINLYNQGQLALVYEHAQALTKQYPEAFVVWNILGAANKGLGNIVEASAAFKKVTLLNPSYADGYGNLGVTLKGQGKSEEAVEAYKKALAIKPDYPEAYYNMGNALNELGKFGEAIDASKKALALKPDYPEAYYNIARALIEQGKLEEAIEAYNKALSIKPDYAHVYNNMGNVFQEQGKLDEAIEAYNKVLAIQPDCAEAHFNIGIVLRKQGKLKEAIEAFKKDGSMKSQIFLLKCLYDQDRPTDFYDKLDYLIDRGENNAVIGSYISRSQIKYGVNRANPFCNEPLKYTLHTNLTNNCNFEDIFIKGATNILTENIVQKRSQSLLTNGIQTTGNVFNQIDSFTDEIQSILRSEIEKYRMFFKDSQEGLIKSWPSDYEIYGWLVSMKSGGKLAAHMHDKGWISGSVYINVPPKVNKNSGNFVICLDSEKNSQSIDVVTGSLCLFPSSLLHYTIPFEAEENRVVLAFDVVPK